MKQARAIHQQKPRGRLSTWQCALSAAYSIIFAFVLPLICWGAYASPGHPHQTPHFIFVEPKLAEHLAHTNTDTLAAEQHTSSHAALHVHHPASTEQVDVVAEAATDQRAAGQATLSLLLFSILTFVALGLWLYSKIDEQQRRRFFMAPFAKSIALPILLPPPRIGTLQSGLSS